MADQNVFSSGESFSITSTTDYIYPNTNTNPYYVWPYGYGYGYTVRCAWCQGMHYGKCPKLKAVSYRPDGTVERIEFFKES